MVDVKGIGDDTPTGWVLDQFSIPMPKTKGQIVEAVGEILGQGKVQKVIIELGKPIVFTRFVRESESVQRDIEEDAGQMSIGDISRNVTLEEYLGRAPSASAFVDILLVFASRRLFLTHIGLGQNSRFFRWLGKDELMLGGLTDFAGAEIVRDSHIPDEAAIFFAGPRIGGRMEAISFALKVHLFLPEDLQEERDGEEAQGPDLGVGYDPEDGSVPDGAVADDPTRFFREGGGVRPEESEGSEGGHRTQSDASSEGNGSGPEEDHVQAEAGGAVQPARSGPKRKGRRR